jgi:RimJ/RimL family protein N-acetyltransferase
VTLELTTNRLQISPLEFADLDPFVNYRQQPEVARFQSWDTDFSKDQGLKLIQSQADISFPPSGEWLQLGVRNKSTGELLGDLALHSLDRENCYEIGFTIDLKHHGKGFGKEAAARLLTHLFDERGAELVEANTDSRNVASIRLLTSLGFSQQASRSWVEEFKNETVTVYVFELNRTDRVLASSHPKGQ